MIVLYKDPGGTFGYRLVLPSGEAVMEGDGHSSAADIQDFLFQVKQTLEDGVVQAEYTKEQQHDSSS